MLNVVAGERFRPVPALYTCAELIWAKLMAVMPKKIAPLVVTTYVSPAPVSPYVT
jgi:hypothetical protein